MAPSAHLIFNPVAGQGDPDTDLAQICQHLEPGLELTIWTTTPEQDADVLAHQALQAGSQLIIASGGDGTLSAAAAALVGSDVPFGVISRGTANGFANALGIPDTIDAACEAILKGGQRRVDAARVQQNDQERIMILLAGIGFEADTVEMADRGAKDRLGVLAYVLSGLRQLRTLQLFEAQLETEDQIIQVQASAITVANAAPSTSILAHGPAGVIPDDGLLDITIISSAGVSSAIMTGYHLLQSALKGSAAERDDIGYLRAKRVTITTDPAQSVVMDGEMLAAAPLTLECLPQSLTVLVPTAQESPQDQKLEGLPGLDITPKAEALEQ
jgi:YegS/Rv2252/BmrU family lipid kinase